MPETSIQSDSPKIKWFVRVTYWIISITVLAGLVAIGVAARTALRAENTLHATTMTLDLLESYVEESDGQWPKSWDDLVSMPQPEIGMYRWPDDRADFEKRVLIDFSADPKVVALQTPEEFEAVAPIGPYFEWNHRHELQSLLQTLKEFHGPKKE